MALENFCLLYAHKKKAEYMNHVWSYDFVETRLEKDRKVRILNVIDEFTKEPLAMDAGFRIRGEDVVEVLRYLFNVRDVPDFIRQSLQSYVLKSAVLSGRSL